MKEDFKFNEIVRFYFVAIELGLKPKIILNKYNHGRWMFADLQIQIRNTRMYTRIYDTIYLMPRIKNFLKVVEEKKSLIVNEKKGA